MATQPRRAAMEGKRDAAIRAVARFTAVAAKERGGKTAAVQEEDRLLVFFEARRDRGAQFLRKNRGDLLLSPLQPKIDDAHQRHLAVVHPLGEIEQPVFLLDRIVITLERRRGGAEKNDALLHFRADDRDIPGVIARRFLLFVGSLVLFIDDDESEIFQRREDGAPRAHHDPGAAGVDLVPFIVPLAFRQMAVQNRDRILRLGEAALETLDGLRRERNLRARARSRFSRGRASSGWLADKFPSCRCRSRRGAESVFAFSGATSASSTALNAAACSALSTRSARSDELIVRVRIARDRFLAQDDKASLLQRPQGLVIERRLPQQLRRGHRLPQF